MTDLPAGVRELDHTADAGIEVEAETLPRLFDLAARAQRILGSPGAPQPPSGRAGNSGERKVAVSLAAEDPGELLVRWLSELLYRMDAHGEAYRSADIRFGAGETSLEADVVLERLGAPGIGLKSVTYHGLECAPRPTGGWHARVIFDV